MTEQVPQSAKFEMELAPSKELILGKLTFYNDRKAQIGTWVATSGQPGFQTAEHYRTKKKGLCPPYKGLEILTAGYPLTTIGVEGMFYPIVPSPIPGYGRSEIGLHKDANVPGSSGCIVVTSSESFEDLVVPMLRLAKNCGRKALDLTINYIVETGVDPSEVDILARTIYGEARGESDAGKVAVAWVVKNRARIGGWWGSDIKEVCLKPYQFSCWNPSDPNQAIIMRIVNSNHIFKRCLAIATDVLAGTIADPTNGANHYHESGIKPTWASGKTPTTAIGNHDFYRL
jgi:N-acetylmuramoyl-L-alanine amidase